MGDPGVSPSSPDLGLDSRLADIVPAAPLLRHPADVHRAAAQRSALYNSGEHPLGIGVCPVCLALACSRVHGFNLPSTRSSFGWYFNPFAWQILFYIGLRCGLAFVRLERLPRALWLSIACVAYLVFAFAVTAPCDFRSLQSLCTMQPEYRTAHMGLWRIAHILALAYIITVSIPANSGWLRGNLATLVQTLGRNSLPVFLAGLILDLLGSILLVELGTGWQMEVLMNGAGVCVLYLTALSFDQNRQSLRDFIAIRTPLDHIYSSARISLQGAGGNSNSRLKARLKAASGS